MEESERVILVNQAQCLICFEVVVSKHQHDFKSCTCGNIFVDGGKDYIRRGYRNRNKFKECSVVLYQHPGRPESLGRFEICPGQ